MCNMTIYLRYYVVVTAGYDYQDSVHCIPCPPHGICVNGGLECKEGFIRQYDKCVEDALIVRNAYRLTNEMHRILAERKGRQECDLEVAKEESELELRAKLERFSYFTEAAFARAQETIVQGDIDNSGGDARIHVRNVDGRVYWTEDATLPFTCRVKFAVRNRMAELIALLSLLGAGAYAYYKKMENDRIAQEVDDLVVDVNRLLQFQKARAAKDEHITSYIAANHVRDTLIHASKKSKRDRLWNAVSICSIMRLYEAYRVDFCIWMI